MGKNEGKAGGRNSQLWTDHSIRIPEGTTRFSKNRNKGGLCGGMLGVSHGVGWRRGTGQPQPGTETQVQTGATWT